MDPLQVALRVLHIVFGTFWAGHVFYSVLIMEPKLRRLGPGIQNPVMGALMPATLPAMTLSSIIVLGTGVVLTLIMRWGALDTLVVTGWGWAMLIGGVATVAAMVVGFGFIVPTGLRLGKLGRSIEGRPPTPEEAQQLQQLSARIETLARANFVLILIAVGTMAAARYL